MTQSRWTDVDAYIAGLLVPPELALDSALAASDAAGLPKAAVAPNQGKLLQVLALAVGARRILEVGTLGGYSTIWLARALPAEGRLITLEREPRHAEVARGNLARAGLAERVEVRVGLALESLQTLIATGVDPFDLIFIDADKAALTEYFDAAVRLSRRGTLIVVDNVVRDGAVLDAESRDPSVQGVRRFNLQVATDSRVCITALQTVGAKGYDGFALAVVVADPTSP